MLEERVKAIVREAMDTEVDPIVKEFVNAATENEKNECAEKLLKCLATFSTGVETEDGFKEVRFTNVGICHEDGVHNISFWTIVDGKRIVNNHIQIEERTRKYSIK